MIYLFVFNYFCFRVHYLLTSAVDYFCDNRKRGHEVQPCSRENGIDYIWGAELMRKKPKFLPLFVYFRFQFCFNFFICKIWVGFLFLTLR